jgi:hypothetical protein
MCRAGTRSRSPGSPWLLLWQSHRLHHMYHNHLTKDMSHPWFTKVSLSLPHQCPASAALLPGRLAVPSIDEVPLGRQELFGELNAFEEALVECPLTMFVKFTFIYLLAGKRDGSHVCPFGKLFTDRKER